jgi:hypothetical protein
MDEKGEGIMVIPYQYMREMAMNMPGGVIGLMSHSRCGRLISPDADP